MEIVLVGLNFRTAPVEVRERAAFSNEQALRAALAGHAATERTARSAPEGLGHDVTDRSVLP